MRHRLTILALAVLCAALAACAGHPSSHHVSGPPAGLRTVPAYLAQCPQAANGHGAPSICAPRAKLKLLAPHPAAPRPGVSSQYFLDLSNNDPCVCGTQIRADGNSGLIAKANQGQGFLDWTEVPMLASARAAGLAIGVYDFDAEYSNAEAQKLVDQAQAAGIYPNTRNAFPLYLDVEWGNFNLGGLIAQVNYLRRLGYRVGMYTGEWYYEPRAGCSLPPGLVSVWLSGYPAAFVWCGVYAYNAHQYTSSPVDRSVFLGSLSQWGGLINATPPGPSPEQVQHWIAARGASLHAYYAHGCHQPVITSGACGQLAWRVDHFQKLTDTGQGYYPRCFGPRRNLGAAECQIVRPAVAVWSRASHSSERWRNYRVARYFDQRIAHTLANSRL